MVCCCQLLRLVLRILLPLSHNDPEPWKELGYLCRTRQCSALSASLYTAQVCISVEITTIEKRSFFDDHQ